MPTKSRVSQEVEISESLGSEYSRAVAYSMLGVAHLVHGECDEVRCSFETSLEISRRHWTGLEFEAHTLAQMARAQLGGGDGAGARHTAEEAVVRARERGQPHYEAIAQLVLARERCMAGGAEAEIKAALDRTSVLVEESGARALEPQILEGRAELMGVVGKDSAHERELREAQRLYTEMGATGHAERLAAEWG